MQTNFPAQATDRCNEKAWNLKGAAGIQYFSYQVCQNGYLYLEEHAILFICAGEFVFQYGEAVFVAKARQAVFLRKDIVVGFQAIAPEGRQGDVGFLLFVLPPAVVLEFAKSAHLQTTHRDALSMVLVHEPGMRSLNCMASVESYFSHGGSISPHLVKIKLLELLYCMPGCRQDQPLLEQVLDLRETFRGNITSVIEANIMNAISLSQLARLSGRSLSSFRRDFLAIYNMPPSRWIRLKRLEKAQELLAGTSMTVTDICYSLGFENIAHFSRLFKAHFGIPPTALRNNPLVVAYSSGELTAPSAHSSLA